MVKPEIIGLAAIALLFILTYPFIFSGSSSISSGSSSDSNQVKVTANDTTPNYLFPKLEAGTGISLLVQNPGGDENILISSTVPGGSGGRTYTSGTPATIEVNNDNNTISQNFDGNFTSRINGLDLNNSLNYAKTDTNCSTSIDCNLLYFKLNPTATQTVGAQVSNFTAAIQALLNQPINIGNPQGNRINDINFYGAQYTSSPELGEGALIVPSNRGVFCVTATEICQDFNAQSNSVGIKEGFLNPIYYAKFGGRSTTMGLYRIGPTTVLYSQWGVTAPLLYGDKLMFDFNNHQGFQPYSYNPIWGVGTLGWGHEDKIVFYGTPNNFVYDANHMGDVNHTGSFDVNGSTSITDNLSVGMGLDVQQDITGHNNLSIDGTGQFGGSIDTNYFNSAQGGTFGLDTNFANIGATGSVFVDGNIFGQTMSMFSAIGTTCNTLCGSVVVDRPWICVEARTTTGAASTCTQNIAAVNCICKN